MDTHDTPPFLRGAKFRSVDTEDGPAVEIRLDDLVGDHESWPRRYTVGMALAFLGIVSAFLLVARFGGWD